MAMWDASLWRQLEGGVSGQGCGSNASERRVAKCVCSCLTLRPKTSFMNGIPHGHVFEEGLTAGSSPRASFEGPPTHPAERTAATKPKNPNECCAKYGCARVRDIASSFR